MTRRILSVWLPGWPIRRLHREGWPVDRPLAAVETHRGQRRITAASASAEAQGVASGQSLAQARAVCPDLVVAESDLAGDQAGLARLAAWCERISPLAAPDPPNGLWIDITGCAHLFGGEQALAATLQQKLAPCRIAIAGTTGAAWALARAATRKTIEIAPSGDERKTLDRLPVALLRLDDRVVAGLHRVGLRSIGELASQPRADITTRFGPAPWLRIHQAYGITAEAIAWPRAPVPWSERKAFAEPIGTAEDLSLTLSLLAQALCARLEASGLGGQRFVATFFRIDDLRPVIEIATAHPLRHAQRLTKLLSAKIETVDPGFGIEAIVLDAVETAPLLPVQNEMERTPQSDCMSIESLSEAIDELSNRIGVERIWQPSPRESHVPERAVTTAAALTSPIVFPATSGDRPLRLLRPPEKIIAIAQMPDDPPAQFRWRGALHRVRAANGPERIAAEWWRRQETQERFRDYYSVEDQNGGRYWLFRTGLSDSIQPGEWFLHGLFG